MKERKRTEFEFNKDFYDLKSIKDTIKDFKDVAEIVFEDKNNKIKIIIKSKEKELSDTELYLEFRNYVLGMMKNKTII
jgi:hypothetical protein